jgi:hypothetical protein
VSYMFRDNKTVIDSLTQPHARLHKWHNMPCPSTMFERR